MQYNLTTTYFSGQKTWVENNGDRVWEVLCNNLPAFGTFTSSEIADVVREEMKLRHVTASHYARALIRNLLEMKNGGLVKVAGNTYRFHGSKDDLIDRVAE